MRRFCLLQLTNQSRMDGGQDPSGQSSSLLPLSGFPMQVRVSDHKVAVLFSSEIHSRDYSDTQKVYWYFLLVLVCMFPSYNIHFN